jgi:ubiquinone/menaquinone biosynthesis C-methylase UbiE
MKMKYKWTAKGLEIRGRYLWSAELVPVLHQHLGVKSGMVAVDVGCGSGFFTRLIAKGLRSRGRVIGIDIDQKLLVAARKISKGENMSSLIEFKEGSAYSLPLPNGFADVVACHTLLYFLERPIKAIDEMMRVAKVGGRVVAVEPDYLGCVIYDPYDEDYVELAYKFNNAVVGTFKKFYGADLTVGSKLPSMFLKAGLADVRVQGYLLPTSPLSWYDRYSIEELVDYFKHSIDELNSWTEVEKRVMKEYGVSEGEFEEYRHKTVNRIRNWMKNPKKMRTHAFMSARCFLVAVGNKTHPAKLDT